MEDNKKKNSSPKKKKTEVTGALGFVETRGKTAAIGAMDIMPKTAEVAFTKRVNIGSGLVTVIYSGEVAAVESAVSVAARLSEKIGTLVSTNVIPRPHKRIYEILEQRSGEESDTGISEEKKLALGMVETEGFTEMIAAADEGIKAAHVVIPGWVTVGGGLTCVFFRGKVAAVHSAVEAGVIQAERKGKVSAAHVIASPHVGTEEVAPIGVFRGESVLRKTDWDAALGILETQGIAALIEGIDAGLKAASVTVQGWEKIGRGITSTLFRGNVADVKSALDAACAGAGKVGKVVGEYIIARPHSELEKGR
ncbi:MAG: BMC domain-containing protein [Elusimicrobiota bacterium]